MTTSTTGASLSLAAVWRTVIDSIGADTYSGSARVVSASAGTSGAAGTWSAVGASV